MFTQDKETQSYEDWGVTIEEQFSPLDIPPEYRHIEWSKEDLTIRQLWDMWLRGELILQPDFQRGYVWDIGRASRYIESIMLDLPTPAIFLSEVANGDWVVVDGHQRLETLIRYMAPLLEHSAQEASKYSHSLRMTPLRLGGIEVLRELIGTTILDLPVETRAQLWETYLTVVKLAKTCHSDMKYMLFTRLNQGSMSLNNQEVRNCLYRGRYNDLLTRLSESEGFLELWGKSKPDKRMKHRELVLRFFALLHRIDKYRMPFRTFLNDEMGANQTLTDDQELAFSKEFELAMHWVTNVFSDKAFRLFSVGNIAHPPGHWQRRRFDIIYEVEMVSFARHSAELTLMIKQMNSQQVPVFYRALYYQLVKIMTTQDFVATLHQATTSPQKIKLRFQLWNHTLTYSISNVSRLLDDYWRVERLQNKSLPCPVCGQIVQLEDALVVVQKPGERLMHRFCAIQSPYPSIASV